MSLLNRSFRVGRLFDIDIYVHVLFVLWMMFYLLRAGRGWLWHLIFVAVLFGVVLLHELGHSFGARLMGGWAHNILLWPLGGLARVSPPHTPWAVGVTTLAGPAVNVLLALFSGTFIVLGGGGWDLLLVNPFGHLLIPPGNSILGYVWIFYQVNLLLLAFNMLPVYPLDGGQFLQCVLWPRLGERRSKFIAYKVGLYGAVAMVVWALTPHGGNMMLFIGLSAGFVCYQQLEALRMGGDFDWGAVVHRPSRLSGGWWKRITRRFGRRRRPKSPRRSSVGLRRGGLADPDRQVGAWFDNVPDLDDDAKRLLRKVEEEGIHALTDQERAKLMDAFRRRRERDRYLH